MAKGGRSKKKAETVFLVCQETGDYNYVLRRKPGGEKLKLKKYSPRLRKHTMHVEKKKKTVPEESRPAPRSTTVGVIRLPREHGGRQLATAVLRFHACVLGVVP